MIFFKEFSCGMLQVLFSSLRKMSHLIVGHFSSTQTQIIKIAILFGLFCVLETTGLHSGINASTFSTSSEVDLSEGYDPVKALVALREQFLNPTSRAYRHRDIISTSGGSSSSWGSSRYSPTIHSSSGSSNHRNIKNPLYPQKHPKEYHRHNSNREHNDLNHHPQNPHNGPNSQQLEVELQPRQRCYVCLPPDKTSREAREILNMFSKEDQSKIADCAEFDQRDSKEYEFPCPPTYDGCILRIHGPNISRACSRYRLNDCKKATSVEFCYCTEPLCNDIKQEPVRSVGRGQREDGDDDDDEDNGQGSGSNTLPDIIEPPLGSGVVQQYTTTTLEDNDKDSFSDPLATFNFDKQGDILDKSSLSNKAPLSFCPMSFHLLSLLAPFYYIFS